MTPEQKLAFGIEIVAAMKASLYNWDIEQGRIDALADTETNLLSDGENYDLLDEAAQACIWRYVQFERQRLHKQALFAAEVALTWLKENATEAEYLEFKSAAG